MAHHSPPNDMTRRDFLGVLAGSAAMASVPGLISHCDQSSKRPNIIVVFDDQDDPYQQRDLAQGQKDLPTLQRMRTRLKDLLLEAHDSFLPGTAYAEWYDERCNLVKTALGNV